MAAAAEGIRAKPCEQCIESETTPPLWDVRNCGGDIDDASSPFFLRVPGATWYRCPFAEIADDPIAQELLTLYWDHKRHEVRPQDLDDVPAILTIAFQIIDRAIGEVRQAEQRAAQREREARRRAAEAGNGGTPKGSASTSASRARIRAQRTRSGMRR